MDHPPWCDLTRCTAGDQGLVTAMVAHRSRAETIRSGHHLVGVGIEQRGDQPAAIVVTSTDRCAVAPAHLAPGEALALAEAIRQAVNRLRGNATCLTCPWEACAEPDPWTLAQAHTRETGHPAVAGPAPLRTALPPDGHEGTRAASAPPGWTGPDGA